MCRVSFHEINGYVSVGIAHPAVTAVSSGIINKSVVSFAMKTAEPNRKRRLGKSREKKDRQGC